MTTNILSNRRRKLTKAFSLIELLVVIAIIGIIAAIAIPNIGNLTGSATTAKNQRNAQNLSSVFSAARAAGYTNTVAGVPEAVSNIVAGVTANGVLFQVPNLSAADQDAVTNYLNYTNSQLIYNSAP